MLVLTLQQVDEMQLLDAMEEVARLRSRCDLKLYYVVILFNVLLYVVNMGIGYFANELL